MRAYRLCLALPLLVLIGCSGSPPEASPAVVGPTLKVGFEIDSIEQIILRPEEILEDIGSFVATDDAFQLSARWHKNNNIPLERDQLREKLEGAAAASPEERESNPSLALARAIKAEETRFIDTSIPHILSFLPTNSLQMETKIHLTAFTRAYAFMTNTQIVADVTSPKLGGSADSILNILLHEVYHIGYGINRLLRSEEPLVDRRKYFALDVLHNEGLATYVAWKARDMYPWEGFDDYKMMEDPDTVREKTIQVNEILSKIDSLPADEWSSLSWEQGVRNRAYYIAGAHMSRLIDEELGRSSLIETIELGPRSFVSLYNTLVDDGLKIIEFAPPTEASISTRMFEYLGQHPGADLSAFDDELEELAKDADSSLEGLMNRLGYRLLYTGRPDDAVCVLKKGVSFYPENANLHDTLAEVYMKSGETEMAITHYSRSLELEPDNVNAKMYLERLQAETEPS
jgi:tetratricopeptide (TPR) repeat protein